MKTVMARDGLLARDSGPWGQTKLSFLDHYCPAAIQATWRGVDPSSARTANCEIGTAGFEPATPCTPCDSLGHRITTPSSNHARSWASVS